MIFIVQHAFVAQAQAVGELRGVGPAESRSFADIEKLARCSIWARCVPFDPAVIAYRSGYQLGQFFYGQFLAGSGVDGLVA